MCNTTPPFFCIVKKLGATPPRWVPIKRRPARATPGTGHARTASRAPASSPRRTPAPPHAPRAGTMRLAQQVSHCEASCRSAPLAVDYRLRRPRARLAAPRVQAPENGVLSNGNGLLAGSNGRAAPPGGPTPPGLYWELITNVDFHPQRTKSASDASMLRRKGHLKEQDHLIDFIIRMHETHTCEEAMQKMEKWMAEHKQDPRRSRLKRLIPSIGSIFLPLRLVEAFREYDSFFSLSRRKYVPPNFAEIRHVVNIAQVHASAEHIRLVTFDADGERRGGGGGGDVGACAPPPPLVAPGRASRPGCWPLPAGTLYADGHHIEQDSQMIGHMINLMRSNVHVGIVTAAGYPGDAAKFEQRIAGLLQAFKRLNLSPQVTSRWVAIQCCAPAPQRAPPAAARRCCPGPRPPDGSGAPAAQRLHCERAAAGAAGALARRVGQGTRISRSNSAGPRGGAGAGRRRRGAPFCTVRGHPAAPERAAGANPSWAGDGIFPPPPPPHLPHPLNPLNPPTRPPRSFHLMGGECNFLLRVRNEDMRLEFVPDSEWKTPTMLAWCEQDIQQMLDDAQTILMEGAARLSLPVQVRRRAACLPACLPACWPWQPTPAHTSRTAPQQRAAPRPTRAAASSACPTRAAHTQVSRRGHRALRAHHLRGAGGAGADGAEPADQQRALLRLQRRQRRVRGRGQQELRPGGADEPHRRDAARGARRRARAGWRAAAAAGCRGGAPQAAAPAGAVGALRPEAPALGPAAAPAAAAGPGLASPASPAAAAAAQVLHVGDRFTQSGNDSATREVCSILWVANPEETAFFIKMLLQDIRARKWAPYIE